MTNKHAGKHIHYHIIVKGHLDAHWQEWFDNLTITATDDGNTIIGGPIRDQAALHGVLKKINDLGLSLIAIYPQA